MVVWSWAGSGLRSCAAISVLLALGGGSGCVLDNPKYDENGLLSGSDSDSVSASASSDSASTTGTGTATGSDTSGSESATGTTTGEPTTTEPTTDATSTTEPTTTEPTTTGLTTGSDSDSDATTGGELCAADEQVDVYMDGDMDGYGAGDSLGKVCPDAIGPGVAANSGDCDDGDGDVHPGAAESCDWADNNCNGLVDEYSGGNTQCILYGTCHLMEYGGHFYYACELPTSPAEPAHEACQALAIGGGAKAYHVKIDGPEERSALAAIVDKLPDDPSIGLADTSVFNQIGDHKWVADGAGLGYGGSPGVDPWAPGQPDKLTERRHLMTRGALQWVDIDGLELKPFLCEAEPGG